MLVYNRLKYKNFCKLVGKTLRETIKFAALLTNATATKGDDVVRQHFDSFGKRVFTTIVYAPSVHSLRWTVLSQLDLHELGLATKWLLLSILCGIDVFHPNFCHLFGADDITGQNRPALRGYVEEACRSGDLERMFAQQELTDVELLSYIKTLHFLVDLSSGSSQAAGEVDFMSCVLKVIFSVAFCLERTRETCYKEGNALLFVICSAHPQLLGRVLHEIETHLALVGKRALYLCDQLPFSVWLWHMNDATDVALVSKLLLANATNSIMFRLAVDALDKVPTRINRYMYIQSVRRLI
jgi:hypothetical protein